jgi:20S proteasome alpha/beta subunit
MNPPLNGELVLTGTHGQTGTSMYYTDPNGGTIAYNLTAISPETNLITIDNTGRLA